MSKEQFRVLVEKVFLQIFIGMGLHFEEVGSTGFGNEYVIYGAKKLRLKLYRDLRNGEINCMVHLVTEAVDIPQQGDGHWKYLAELCGEMNNKTVEELLLNVPDKPLSDMEQLDRIKKMVESHFSKISAFISGQ